MIVVERVWVGLREWGYYPLAKLDPQKGSVEIYKGKGPRLHSSHTELSRFLLGIFRVRCACTCCDDDAGALIIRWRILWIEKGRGVGIESLDLLAAGEDIGIPTCHIHLSIHSHQISLTPHLFYSSLRKASVSSCTHSFINIFILAFLWGRAKYKRVGEVTHSGQTVVHL